MSALNGGVNNDTFTVLKGSGATTIADAGGANDTLLLGAGIGKSDVTFTRSGDNLVLTIKSGDQVTIQNQFAQVTDAAGNVTHPNSIETLKYADGTTVDLWNSVPLTYNGSEQGDTITGWSGNDTINANGGDDVVYGMGGNDLLNGGAGNDSLNGGDGNDALYGGGGNDVLDGANGNDTLQGDGGSDTLIGGAGDDTYVFNVGNGADTIIDTSGNDTIKFGSGITLNSLTLTRVGNDLVVKMSGSDQITIKGQFSGNAVETFTFSDNSQATVANLLDQAPIAAASASLTVAHGHAVASQMVATDPDNDPLSYSLQTGPAHGAVTFTDTAGHYTYTAGDVVGPDSFTLQVSDGRGGIATQTVSVNVTNAAPTVDASSTAALAVAHGHTVSGQILGADADGDALSYSVKTGPASGTFAFTDTAGHYTYTAGDAAGADGFTLQVSDGHGGVTTQSVSVTVTNAAPTVDASSTAALAVAHGHTVSGQVLGADADGDALSYSVKAAPAAGTLAFTDAAGHYTYTAGDVAGADSFTLQVSDGHGGVATQAVSVTVTNAAPTVDASSVTGSEDVPVSGKIVGSDADGDTLSYGVATGPAHGTLALDANTGAYSYSGAANWSGTDAFSVAVSDGHGGLATTTVGVTLAAVADTPTLSAAVLGSPGAGTDTIRGHSGNDVIETDPTASYTLGLDIKAALGDLDGSEKLSVTVAGLLPGTALSAGHDNGDGSWTLGASDLAGLTVSTPGTDKMTLSITATATEQSNGSTAIATTSVVVDAAQVASGVTALGDKGDDIILGGAGNDTLHGNSGNDVLAGGGGNDVLYGDSGNDTIFGGSGDDLLVGGSGNDRLVAGSGNDTLDAGSGDDVMVAGTGHNVYDGGSGFDTIDFSSAGNGVEVNLALHTVMLGGQASTITNTEAVIGTAGNDTLIGDKNANVLVGGAGDDVLNGGAGNDTLSGGQGHDTFVWAAKDITAANGLDHVTDFDRTADAIDVRGLLAGQKYTSLGQVLHATDTAAGTVLSVAVKGGGFTDFATLDGVHGVTTANLATAEWLIH